MKYIDDYEFNMLTYEIMQNEEFLKLSGYLHHCTNRLDHSLRVSYYSYIIAKALKLNYEEVAVGGLLHDFFHEDYDNAFMRIYSMFTHAKKAVSNASRLFYLTDMEKDIISTHMFPISIYNPPRYLESWLVSMVDKVCAVYEFTLNSRKVLTYKHVSNTVLVVSVISQLI